MTSSLLGVHTKTTARKTVPQWKKTPCKPSALLTPSPSKLKLSREFAPLLAGLFLCLLSLSRYPMTHAQ